MVKKVDISGMIAAFDRLVEMRSQAVADLEDTDEYKNLQQIEDGITDSMGKLKEYSKTEGDFTTKFYRFSTYDKKLFDHKGMINWLVKENKVDPREFVPFVKIQRITQVALIKSNNPIEDE